MLLSFPTINDSTLFLLGFSVVFGIFAPIISCIVALFKIRKTVVPLLYGFVLYLFAQLFVVNLIGGLFIEIFGLSQLYADGNAYVTCAVLVITSICEETTRFVCLAYMMKSYRKFNDSLMFGMGYGAASLFIATIISSLNSLITATAINSGAVSELDAVTSQSIYDFAVKISETPSVAFITPLIDQCCLSILSVALSVFMLSGINKDNRTVLAAATVIRVCTVCGPVILTALWSWGFITSSLFLVLIAGFCIWYIVKNKPTDPSKPKFRTI